MYFQKHEIQLKVTSALFMNPYQAYYIYDCLDFYDKRVGDMIRNLHNVLCVI